MSISATELASLRSITDRSLGTLWKVAIMPERAADTDPAWRHAVYLEIKRRYGSLSEFHRKIEASGVFIDQQLYREAVAHEEEVRRLYESHARQVASYYE
jgi:hypothetical protein